VFNIIPKVLSCKGENDSNFRPIIQGLRKRFGTEKSPVCRKR